MDYKNGNKSIKANILLEVAFHILNYLFAGFFNLKDFWYLL